MLFAFVGLFLSLVLFSEAYRYSPAYVQYNLNQNEAAVDSLDYWGEWNGHEYTPSPKNWRFPFYTLFLDRYVNGDPTNDNSNETAFEHDLNSNQMRHGGDWQGLLNSLDYIQGMGVKGLYIAGSPFINQPWGYDQYSPLDLSILDPHFGTIDVWRNAVEEIHKRSMYVLLDHTMATMGDLIGFEGYLNTTTPFSLQEHKAQWKSERHYWDFDFGNTYNKTCDYPRFWNETGYPIDQEISDRMVGCYDSDFDQYGDTEAFGVFPDWRRQLSKFASVQDRLREWHSPVLARLENFYCMVIAQLDIDGFRYDKATQSTVDAMGHMSESMRVCAKRFGKENFFIPGEITGGNDFGSIFVGRGRQPDQRPENLTEAVALTNSSSDRYFLRDPESQALDSGAFHYTVYRTLTRFLGMDGNLAAGYDAPMNWVDQWNSFLMTNDLINAETGVFDPRHMFGVTNQDVFRWPAISQGTERQLLGHFITSLLLPGIPLLLWGEEQAFYILDNTASNYIFGRQAMSSATAWQVHGCYHLDSTQYFQMPLESARHGCSDESVALDHRDPSAPVYNIIRHMMKLREKFVVLSDGFYLQQLSNQTWEVTYPGSSDVPTETGMWSVMRSEFADIQDLSDDQSEDQGPTPVWLVYSNLNATQKYEFQCADNSTGLNTTALLAPYGAGTTVKNLLAPYDEQELGSSAYSLGIGGSENPNGCLSTLEMVPYDFRAYVPIEQWVGPDPSITKFSPGHDARLLSSISSGETEDVDIALEFSVEMDCDSVYDSISFESRTENGDKPSVDRASIECRKIEKPAASTLVGGIDSTWSWSATLNGIGYGVHMLTVSNASATSGGSSMNSVARFMFRVGQQNNPIVFPLAANYSTTLLSSSDSGHLTLNHSAAGADSFRYSTNFGSSFSDWMPYQGGVHRITKQSWSGTSLQSWDGEHVRVEYFSSLAGSSDHVQQADVDSKQRRFPNMFLNGPYNQYGYDAGLNNKVQLSGDNEWTHNWMVEWSAHGSLAQLNIWGVNPDGQPDQSAVYGDADGDSVLDRLPPSSLSSVVLNITEPPPKPFLSWRFVINDGNMRFRLVPVGSMWAQLALYILLWTLPVITATASTWLFIQSFYKVKFNKVGVSEKAGLFPWLFKRSFQPLEDEEESEHNEKPSMFSALRRQADIFMRKSDALATVQDQRRTVLIATMEYDIEDWGIKIKIGGLGVMAQLMGKNLSHQDLIWVVPCVGGIDYPEDQRAEPMLVTVMGVEYEVDVQYHKLRNITYVLLDSPVFRAQTKSEPYPARMDDMVSAVYYSAWNQCIAQAIDRFPIDLYHINDYHGTIAPLYLLPRTIPACLSLHNAEFQGLWPMRNKKEREEVCSVFNLPWEVVVEYVMFGEIFNLLHAGASYLRVHQQGFGAVGVSKKYGKRSYARYPILWGLKRVQALQNPDPSDTGEWDKKLPREEDIHVDQNFEIERLQDRVQAQEWAGLEKDPKAELFVFVGRWSMQKGVDLIADAFPAILEANPKVQLIAIGPVIDLYGKFAALKLERLMKMYPTRVCSKPVFTALPPHVFSGAEFALIPSRDEPFGLVAVEFGRKGAIGVGARVGGLGQMPGWWYTVESTTTSHLLKQFKEAIRGAIASSPETRAMMRARSAKQRFPVAQWVEDLEILQTTAIRMYEKSASPEVRSKPGVNHLSAPTGNSSIPIHRTQHFDNNGDLSSGQLNQDTPQTTLGSEHGPGHILAEDYHESSDEPREHDPAPDTDLDPDAVGKALSLYLDDDGDMRFDRHRAPGLSRPHPTGTSTPDYKDVPTPLFSPTLTVPSGFSTPRASMDRFSNARFHSSVPGTPLRPSTPDELKWPMPSTNGFPKDEFNPLGIHSRNHSTLSVDLVVGQKTDFKLQQVDPFFTDSRGLFYREFEKKLENLDGKNSEGSNCIEEFLVKAEKTWFNSFRDAKLGRHKHEQLQSARSSVYRSVSGTTTPRAGPGDAVELDSRRNSAALSDEFLLGDNYQPPTWIKKWMQVRMIGDWPLYAILLALGQIIAANSYQITLLTGEIGQTANKLYVVASIYLVASIFWWFMFRRLASAVTLSLPFLFYGTAFILIGVAHYASPTGREWIQNVGTALYAFASASGAFFFALNFGDEGGTMIKVWCVRACIIQGTQQLYVVALWCWGHVLTTQTQDGVTTSVGGVAGSWVTTAITLPIAFALWGVGFLLWLGLPNYYRQIPGKMPSFYTAALGRKVLVWFLITAVIQNFFMSAPYGRNWSFLFSSVHAETWQVILLVFLFFIGVWAAFLGIFGYLSKTHSWILPLFAIGLGAPRFAQIWWGTSNIGLYLPWAGSPVSGALLSRALWLWLGVLDAVQGVGLGMILLGTLTRVHVAFAVTSMQVVGSIATMIARAVAPNNIGPGPVSPDITGGVSGLGEAWFWVALAFNLLICVGFYKFYRKEQLQKP
ncbi:Cell wall alpha-1,3-glucan synthase ags1 [Vermiconidia calcicola]|uniref:Cell wall alpha-1,3-glucan synthase ags1 n=1 Tax=Vermiconidia calcicola TaxID=1690605 RepID=A0ACC3ND46_9PEZI|nr:Cell wall alpha-1,3-glucan synthase ags1 [Vermiconidia calcicola]